MSRSERAKGVRGEREVLELLERHGFEVRGLEASGDHLALGHGVTLHVETKRQEVARPWAWYGQAVDEAPNGTVPVVAFRRSRSPWLALVDLEALCAMLEASGNGVPGIGRTDLGDRTARLNAAMAGSHGDA